MKYSKLVFPFVVFAFLNLLSLRGWTKVEYDSVQLKMKNGEQMNDIIKKKIQAAQKIQAKQQEDDDEGLKAEPEAVQLLRDAMRIVLSRPDQDGTRANLFSLVRHELTDLNSVDSVLTELGNEAVAGLKSSSTAVREQSTDVVILENLMAEIRPEMSTTPAFKKIIEKIRDAHIEISEKLKLDERLHSMNNVVSPSETAEKILPKGK